MAKRVLFITAMFAAGLLLLGALALMTLRWITPALSLYNDSAVAISDIHIKLPSSDLRFDPLQPGEHDVLYYDAKQQDGHYRLQLNAAGTLINHSCGIVSPGQWGKQTDIIIDAEFNISCVERIRF